MQCDFALLALRQKGASASPRPSHGPRCPPLDTKGARLSAYTVSSSHPATGGHHGCETRGWRGGHPGRADRDPQDLGRWPDRPPPGGVSSGGGTPGPGGRTGNRPARRQRRWRKRRWRTRDARPAAREAGRQGAQGGSEAGRGGGDRPLRRRPLWIGRRRGRPLVGSGHGATIRAPKLGLGAQDARSGERHRCGLRSQGRAHAPSSRSGDPGAQRRAGLVPGARCGGGGDSAAPWGVEVGPEAPAVRCAAGRLPARGRPTLRFAPRRTRLWATPPGDQSHPRGRRTGEEGRGAPENRRARSSKSSNRRSPSAARSPRSSSVRSRWRRRGGSRSGPGKGASSRKG